MCVFLGSYIEDCLPRQCGGGVSIPCIRHPRPAFLSRYAAVAPWRVAFYDGGGAWNYSWIGCETARDDRPEVSKFHSLRAAVALQGIQSSWRSVVTDALKLSSHLEEVLAGDGTGLARHESCRLRSTVNVLSYLLS